MTATLETVGSTRCIPRFATPRDERYPTLGPQVGEIARRLGKPLMPWQQDSADVAYEYDPDSGLFRYDETDVTVPRQSGKTTITLAKKVHRLTVLARRWGPQRSTYTAQTRLAARKKLERDFADVLRASRSFREVPNAKARPQRSTQWRLSLNNGSESIQFGASSFLQIDAPTRTAGHGDTLDDGTIDEAFAQEDDTVEGSMRPAMATRRNAQLWVISTAGDARSVYLWRKILAGRNATATGSHGRVCYIEYSAPDDADPGDPATWWACMPALGITIREEFIRGEWERAQRKGPEGIDTFRRAYLNQWPEIPILDPLAANRVIGADLWRSLGDESSQIAGQVEFAVDVTPDRGWASIAAAGLRKDGLVHVELVEHRAGTSWIPGRLLDLIEKHDGLGVAVNPATALLPDLEEAGVKCFPVKTGDYVEACGSFYDKVIDGRLRHMPSDDLNGAVSGAQKRNIGDGWAWDRRDQTVDISPLVAATLAASRVTTGRDFFGSWG